MKILCAGAGALGSNVTKLLAIDLRGRHEITVLDFDTVEERNTRAGTQFFFKEQHGLPKVEALQYNIYKQYGRKIEILNKNILSDWDLGPILGSPMISVSANNKKSVTSIETPGLVIDCFDNYKARFMIQSSCYPFEIPLLHAGFSPQFTFAIEWAENYQVPTDDTSGFDICETEGAASFINMVSSLVSLTAQEYIFSGKKREFVGSKTGIVQIT